LDVRFYVLSQSTRDENCVNHLILDSEGQYKRAFTSDCVGWDPAFTFFLVYVEATGTEPVTVRLKDIAVLSRSGEASRAIDVGLIASNPNSLWTSETTIRPGRRVSRFVVFDSSDLHVRAIGLEIGDMLFVVAFDSRERLQAPVS
jgi:hypothetical protein